MEPVSAIALGASVIGIFDVVTRTISALRKLQQRWISANMTVGALLGQLSTLKAALGQIAKWIETSLVDSIQHHQLVIDLGASLDSCSILVSVMDGYLSELDWDESNSLTFESKTRSVLQDGSMKECISHLSHQSIALNLLLTALNCQSLSEQKELLEASQSRQILDQVKDDSSSLVVLRDSDSFRSSWATSTVRSSVLNQVFHFDREIVSSKVYQSNMRSLIRRVFRKRHPQQVIGFKDYHRVQVVMWAGMGQSYECIEATIDRTCANNYITPSLTYRLLLEIYPLQKERIVLIESPVHTSNNNFFKFRSTKYVRPRWHIDSQQGNMVHEDIDFLVLEGPIDLQFSEVFGAGIVLGEDFSKKSRDKHRHILGPQISSATQTNYY